jgi:hypothetical protein
MTNFEFLFSLFGLLLGLSLAELLGGFARSLQRRAKLRIGWLLPLLGLLILLDVASFWMVAWSVRDAVPIAYFPLMVGLLICCLYYLVAALVFPHDLDEWQDFDTYYFQHRSLIIGGMILCNGLALAGIAALGIDALASITDKVSIAIFLVSAAALLLVRDKRASLALLVFMVLQYPIFAAVRMIG